MRRSFRMKLWAVLLCLLTMLSVCANAVADESVQVSIPVIAWGHDCSVALFDSNGNRVQLLALTKGEQNAFNLQLTGLKRFTYRALVYDEHTDKVIFDTTNYLVTVEVIYGADGNLSSLVSIEKQQQEGVKYGRLEFTNTPVVPPSTPTPKPTPVPTPIPTLVPTPVPYDHSFSFTKVWSGGNEDSIDWTMYNADGTKRHKLFNKEVISEYEWRYEAYFQSDVSDCYIIETPVKGYQVIYKNIAPYSDVTDRCHDGGTILNYKLPDTGDKTPVADYTALIMISMLGACLLISVYRRYLMGKKS